MRLAIFGTGAIGAYFGGRLAQAGEDVVFVARGAQLHALRDSGLTLRSADGDQLVHPLQVGDDPRAFGTVDVVLLGVKAWQVPEAARQMQPLIDDSTCVLPLQNGVDAPTILAGALGERHVLAGMAKIIAETVEPGVVEHLAVAPYIALGELDNARSERVESLAAVLTRSGVVAEVPDDIHRVMWEKFLFISAVSGVGAVTRTPLGVLRELPETREMIREAMAEILRVARADGISMRDEIVDESLEFIDKLPHDSTSSMHRDVVAGRPSELEFQNGAVVRLGRERGVPTPLNTFLYHSLLPLELEARETLATNVGAG